MFVYVFSTQDRDTLLDKGYHLVKSDDINYTYIFVCDDNADVEKFSVLDKYAFSNVLSF